MEKIIAIPNDSGKSGTVYLGDRAVARWGRLQSKRAAENAAYMIRLNLHNKKSTKASHAKFMESWDAAD